MSNKQIVGVCASPGCLSQASGNKYCEEHTHNSACECPGCVHDRRPAVDLAPKPKPNPNPNPDNLSATVRVQLVVEVTVGNWNASETFVSLREQAIREAKQALETILQKGNTYCQIVGKPVSMNVVLKGELK